jgi:hypothetical protein
VNPVIVEERTYTTHPGKWREYLALYEAEGLQIQHRILGRMVGYYTTETGELNQIVHLWAYQSLDERSERRSTLLGHPGFRAYVAKMLPLLQKQESRILRAAPFFMPMWQEP